MHICTYLIFFKFMTTRGNQETYEDSPWSKLSYSSLIFSICKVPGLLLIVELYGITSDLCVQETRKERRKEGRMGKEGKEEGRQDRGRRGGREGEKG